MQSSSNLLGALGIGALLGWHQGKLMAITVDASTGTLQVKASVWALLAAAQVQSGQPT